MSDDFSLSLSGMEGVLAALDESSGLTKELTYGLMHQIMQDVVFAGSQNDVPVDKGDLKASGQVVVEDNGLDYNVSVAYEGQPTAKTYDFPDGIQADNTAWMIELGHLSRAGNPVPAQAFLGPNFDKGAVELQNALDSLFS